MYDTVQRVRIWRTCEACGWTWEQDVRRELGTIVEDLRPEDCDECRGEGMEGEG